MRGDTIDIFPAENSETAFRVELFDGDVEEIILFDPLTGKEKGKVRRIIFILFALCNAS